MRMKTASKYQYRSSNLLQLRAKFETADEGHKDENNL